MTTPRNRPHGPGIPSAGPATGDIVDRLRAAGCVFAEDEAALLIEAADTAGPAALDALVQRRVDGEPLEHLLGWVEFCGLRVAVGPGVFVPRRRTEFLARHAAALAPPRARILDLCCGCGAVAAAITALRADTEVHAAELDPIAVDYARRNLTPSRVHQGDLYAALSGDLRGRLDVVVCNAPYVPTDAIGMMPPEARDHEPRLALDGGGDGLDIQRQVAAGASDWLAPGGHLLIESSTEQAPRLAEVFAAHGLTPEIVGYEDLGATIVVGGPAR